VTFAGINYLSILIAAVVAWLFGAVWYMSLANPWKAALGMTPEQLEECKKGPRSYLPFFYVFASNLVMAWVLAGVLGHLGNGQVTIRNGIISGLFCWLGFVITTMLANYSFGMRKPMLLLIDGAHWLLVLVLMGAIIGAMGV
jgi:hypothetical protein